VVSAGGRSTPEDLDAVAELCRAYWYPIYAFIRRKGHSRDEAQDLTQSYFIRLLESRVLIAADRNKGRFRAFLRTDCGHFLADQRDRDRALKRGGGVSNVSFDAHDAEARYLGEPADDLTPQRLFDRAWAVTLLGRSVEHVAREYADSGRARLFERLQVVLTDNPHAVPYATIAEALGTTVVAVQSAVQRLRRRFRESLRAEITATLDDPSPAAVEEEVRALFTALGR
jgi:RNA polymerase sigma-70 factor (ECF subfamily)